MSTHFVDENMPHWQAVLSSILENAASGDTVVVDSQAGADAALAAMLQRTDGKTLLVLLRETYEKLEKP